MVDIKTKKFHGNNAIPFESDTKQARYVFKCINIACEYYMMLFSIEIVSNDDDIKETGKIGEDMNSDFSMEKAFNLDKCYIINPNGKDFYIVSTKAPKGKNAIPTRFVVLFDDFDLKSYFELQMFCYQNTYLYYDWDDAVRVPHTGILIISELIIKIFIYI